MSEKIFGYKLLHLKKKIVGVVKIYHLKSIFNTTI